MNINTNNTTKPYIDQDYYTNVFKPNKNAMIIGSFNNVDAHVADFDAFRQRASELVDRLVSNKITEAGGIDFISPTPQTFLKKATGAIVQFWFINGYTVSNLDNMLSLGSLNIHQTKNNETFRKLIGLDALLLIQKSGMWDRRVFGVDVSEKLRDLGIDVSDILLMSDALAIFQQKGTYDDNFHVDIDFSGELTGTAGLDRWIKVIETTKQHISFNITGGSKTENARALVFIDKDDFSSGISEAYIYSTKLVTADQRPNYYVKNENGTLSVYIMVEDDLPTEDANFLISDIHADDAGEYKLFGSQTVDNGLTKLDKANILQSADLSVLQQRLTQLENDIQTIQSSIQQIEANKQAIASLQTSDTTNKNKIRVLEQQQATNTAQIASIVQNIATNLASITNLQSSVLKKDGSVQVDSSFIPKRDYDIVYLKTVKDLETKLRTEFTQISAGFETEWTGSESFTKVSGSEEGTIDASVLSPQLGSSFTFTNNRKMTITFKLSNREETIITRVGNDDKWDEVITEFQTNDDQQLLQIKLLTTGELKLRAVDDNGTVINWANIVDIPVITSLHQITGNVYSISSVDVDDTKIQELEGVAV